MNKLLFIPFIILLSLNFAIAAEKNGVEVHVSLSPAGSFQVKSNKVKGKLSRSGSKILGEGIKVSVKTLKSGIDTRDNHMYERLEYKTHSKIEIVKAIGEKGNGKGIINIKGIKKTFSFKYKDNGDSITASFKLNLQDFKIKDLRYMSVGVEDTVSITATIPIK